MVIAQWALLALIATTKIIVQLIVTQGIEDLAIHLWILIQRIKIITLLLIAIIILVAVILTLHTQGVIIIVQLIVIIIGLQIAITADLHHLLRTQVLDIADHQVAHLVTVVEVVPQEVRKEVQLLIEDNWYIT